MVREPRRVGRRDLWRARLHGWRGRLREKRVWIPLLVGVAILGGAVWWYADRAAFAHRAVTTTAVVEDTYMTRLEHEDGPPSLVVRGRLRYVANAATVHSYVRLAGCDTSVCVSVMREWKGKSVEVVYDPRRTTRVRIGHRVSLAPNPLILVVFGFGVLAVGIAVAELFILI